MICHRNQSFIKHNSKNHVVDLRSLLRARTKELVDLNLDKVFACAQYDVQGRNVREEYFDTIDFDIPIVVEVNPLEHINF